MKRISVLKEFLRGNYLQHSQKHGQNKTDLKQGRLWGEHQEVLTTSLMKPRK